MQLQPATGSLSGSRLEAALSQQLPQSPSDPLLHHSEVAPQLRPRGTTTSPLQPELDRPLPLPAPLPMLIVPPQQPTSEVLSGSPYGEAQPPFPPMPPPFPNPLLLPHGAPPSAVSLGPPQPPSQATAASPPQPGLEGPPESQAQPFPLAISHVVTRPPPTLLGGARTMSEMRGPASPSPLAALQQQPAADTLPGSLLDNSRPQQLPAPLLPGARVQRPLPEAVTGPPPGPNPLVSPPLASQAQPQLPSLPVRTSRPPFSSPSPHVSLWPPRRPIFEGGPGRAAHGALVLPACSLREEELQTPNKPLFPSPPRAPKQPTAVSRKLFAGGGGGPGASSAEAPPPRQECNGAFARGFVPEAAAQGVASRDYTPEPVTVEEQCRNGLMSSLSMKLWLRLRRIILGIDGSFDCQMDLVKYTTQLKGEVPLGAGTSNEVWLLEGSDPALGRFVVRLPRLDGNLTLPTMTLWQQLSAEHNSLHANLSLGQKDRGGVPVVGMLFVRRQRGWDGRAAWQILREGAKEPGLDLGAALESGDLNVALVYRRCIDLKELLALLLALPGVSQQLARLLLVGRVLDPLRALTTAGVRHYDIKPANFVGRLQDIPEQLCADSATTLSDLLMNLKVWLGDHDSSRLPDAGASCEDSAAVAGPGTLAFATPARVAAKRGIHGAPCQETPEQAMAFQTALVALLLLTGAKQSPALVCKEYADAQPIAELQRPVRADLVVAAGGLGMMDAWMRTNVAAAADAIGSVLDHVRRGEMWSWMDESDLRSKVTAGLGRLLCGKAGAAGMLQHLKGVALNEKDAFLTLENSLGAALLELAGRQWCDGTGRLLRVYVAAAAAAAEAAAVAAAAAEAEAAAEATAAERDEEHGRQVACPHTQRTLLHQLVGAGQVEGVRLLVECCRAAGDTAWEALFEMMATQDQHGCTPLQLGLLRLQYAAAWELLKLVRERLNQPPKKQQAMGDAAAEAGAQEEAAAKGAAAGEGEQRAVGGRRLPDWLQWLLLVDKSGLNVLHAACLLPVELGPLQSEYLALLQQHQPGATAFSHLRGQLLPAPSLLPEQELVLGHLEPLLGVGGAGLQSAGPSPPPAPELAGDCLPAAEDAQLCAVLCRLLQLLGDEAGELVQAKTYSGETPLHFQAALGCLKGLQLLRGVLPAPSALLVKDKDGLSPVERAVRCNMLVTVAAGKARLETAGVRLVVVDEEDEGLSLIHI